MIERSVAVDICGQTTLTDIEQLAVIRRYIFDKKGVDVGQIERPTNLIHIHIMGIAFNACCIYYLIIKK